MEVDTIKFNTLPEGTQNLSVEEITEALGKCKQEAQQICSKMEDLGEESVILSVNMVSKAVTYLGSNIGRDFLMKRLDIIDSFFGFCNEAYSEAVAESPRSPVNSNDEFLKESFMTPNRSPVKTNKSLNQSPTKSKMATIQSPSGSAMTSTLIPNLTQSPNQTLDQSASKSDLSAKQLLLQKTVSDSVISGLSKKSARKSMCQDKMKPQSPVKNLAPNDDIALHHLHDGNINFNDLFEVNKKEILNSDLIELGEMSDASTKKNGCSDLNDKENEEYFTEVQKNVSKVSSPIGKNDRDSLQRETNSAIVVLEKLVMKEGKLENAKDYVFSGNEEKVTNEVREKDMYAGNSDNDMDNDIGLFEQTTCAVQSDENYTATANCKTENKEFISRRSGRKRKTPNYKQIMKAKIELDPDWEIKNEIIENDGKKRRKGKAGPTQCVFCGQTFKNQTGFVQHMAKHADSKPFKCEVCEKQFMNSGLYKIHVNSHSKCEEYVCDICGKLFKRMGGLTLHRKKQHLNRQELLCLTCGKKFKHKSDFQRHSLIHTDNKPYSCDICQKRFYHTK